MRQYFLMDAVDALILSEHNATAGNHHSLDYIPASAIFGAIAAQLYSEFSAEESWHVFHSGGLRVGNFLPVSGGSLGYPVPFSWHHPKVKQDDSKIFNLTKMNREDANGVQLKQMRDAYINAFGQPVQVKRGTTTKTALDSESGTAKDGQLFNYQFIQQGQQFLGWLESDEPHVLKQASKVLTQGIRIGRSRNSEFGRVRAQQVNLQVANQVANHGTSLTLWCISDALFLDETGAPSVVPSFAGLIDNAEFTIEPSHSFVRTRRTSRFNQKRGGYDSEVMLVEKGSVFQFRLSRELTSEELSRLAERGIGLQTELGLGQVVVNPAWANTEQLNLTENVELFKSVDFEVPQQQSNQRGSSASSVLTRWVASLAGNAKSDIEDREKAERIFARLVSCYRSLRGYNLTPAGHVIGPSKTQWGHIRNAVMDASTLSELKHKLFNDEHCICAPKKDTDGWGAKLQDQVGEVSFAQWFKTTLDQHLADGSWKAVMLNLIEELGKHDLSDRKELAKAESRVRVLNGEKGGSK